MERSAGKEDAASSAHTSPHLLRKSTDEKREPTSVTEPLFPTATPSRRGPPMQSLQFSVQLGGVLSDLCKEWKDSSLKLCQRNDLNSEGRIKILRAEAAMHTLKEILHRALVKQTENVRD